MAVVILRQLVRLVGTLAGGIGVAWIVMGVAAPFTMSRGQPATAISLVYIVMGFYFLYVTYLVWWRLSRRGLLHVSVVLVLVGPSVLRWAHVPDEQGTLWLICLGAALVFYWISSRLMFPAEEQ